MKTLITMVLMGCCLSFNALAMRCGTKLINEGDSVARMLDVCGQPTVNRGQYVVYINKDQDGMTYTIHSNEMGIIDDITFSRG